MPTLGMYDGLPDRFSGLDSGAELGGGRLSRVNFTRGHAPPRDFKTDRERDEDLV